jgi:hypothetical protein
LTADGATRAAEPKGRTATPDSDVAQRNGERFAAGRDKDVMLKTLRKGTGSATLHDYLQLTTREVCRDYSLSRPAPREQPSFRFPTRTRSQRRWPPAFHATGAGA